MFVNRGLLLRFVALFPLSPSRTHFEILFPSSKELLFRVIRVISRNDSMSFQRWGMALPVKFVPCCRVYCWLLVLFLGTNATYVHGCLPLGLCILNFGHPCSFFFDYHACEKDPG